jgi:diaminohydroxyphosphoribosylaminopyrimidine deaminase / 5-amino-6-(5-phosphoribosylamino)uracil reductase
MTDAEDIKYMRRCLELAAKGEGLTWPNPMVGSVIVHDGMIIGEGYHIRSGGPHAEVLAIKAVADQTKLERSTIYVSLEPCSHFGKTPPCADLIIEKRIPRVVIGAVDSNEKVSGKGIAKLEKAGCEVLKGVLEDESRWLNRRFFTFHEKKRPYIILKWAQSSDNLIDLARAPGAVAEPNWITGKPERALVHKWRSEEQAILVGGGTVRADDPKLNVRDWAGSDPLRIVLSGTADLSNSAHVFSDGRKTILFTCNPGAQFSNTMVVQIGEQSSAIDQIAGYLYENGIQSLFVEGGTTVLNEIISLGLWDEARIFKGNRIFGEGVKAPEISGRLQSVTRFRTSSLEIILNGSPA